MEFTKRGAFTEEGSLFKRPLDDSGISCISEKQTYLWLNALNYILDLEAYVSDMLLCLVQFSAMTLQSYAELTST